MGKYIIQGGKKLTGEIKISGSKNAALPILAACVLVKGTVELSNVPKITDVLITIDILRSLGAKVLMEGNTVTVDSTSISSIHVPERLVKKMRSSIIFMGSLLGRFKEVTIGYPGGCQLGKRPIDLHLNGLEQLGVRSFQGQNNIYCVADNLIGSKIKLNFPSVGATQNIILGAVCANGTTTIVNGAKEPEIHDLIKMLNACGANIKVNKDIVIEGVNTLIGAHHKVMPDRIVAGTYIAATAITKGDIIIKQTFESYMDPLIDTFLKLGLCIESTRGVTKVTAGELIVQNIKTGPHPGFPTDMQPQLMATLCFANGISSIEETIFEARNKHVSQLNKMGANITTLQSNYNLENIPNSIFVIAGGSKLVGTVVKAKDLRGGAALILAGLAAEGKTVVEDANFLERGYESIDDDLLELGADIKHSYFENKDEVIKDVLIQKNELISGR